MMGPSRNRRLGNGVSAACLIVVASCGPRPITWHETSEFPAAKAPSAPAKCALDEARFTPSRPVLLGHSPTELFRWAKRHLPDNYRVGQRRKLGLMPSKTPGTALQAHVSSSKVALVTIQSHARIAADASPFAKEALKRFLLDAAGCSSYRLCQAAANLEEVTYTGYTTCPEVRVPLRLVTTRYRREVTSITVWVPHLVNEGTSE